MERAHGRLAEPRGSAGDDCSCVFELHGAQAYKLTAVMALKPGDKFPDLKVESRDGDVQLSDRWRNGPLVVAFMRHFG